MPQECCASSDTSLQNYRPTIRLNMHYSSAAAALAHIKTSLYSSVDYMSVQTLYFAGEHDVSPQTTQVTARTQRIFCAADSNLTGRFKN